MEKKERSFITAACAVMLVLWLGTSLFAMFSSSSYSIGRQSIQYKIKKKHSGFLQEGWKVWVKEGSPGYKNAVTENFSFAGIPVKQNIIFETGVLKKPVEAMLVLGHSKKTNPVTVPKETYAHYTYDMEATAYDPSPESNGVEWAGITALGWRTRYGIAAVDPRIIALRSLIYVDGYGFAWAGDTGGDIKGKRIDLCYNTTKEALKWGRKKVRVYVLGSKPWSHYRKKTDDQKKIK